MTFEDALDFINALTASAGNLVFSTLEGGKSTYSTHTIGGGAGVGRCGGVLNERARRPADC